MKIKKITKVTFGAFFAGTVIFGIGHFQTQAQQEQPSQPAAATATVTDCFESREG